LGYLEGLASPGSHHGGCIETLDATI
jgi:hypothetical protein